jgi:hypothetical protein
MSYDALASLILFAARPPKKATAPAATSGPTVGKTSHCIISRAKGGTCLDIRHPPFDSTRSIAARDHKGCGGAAPMAQNQTDGAHMAPMTVFARSSGKARRFNPMRQDYPRASGGCISPAPDAVMAGGGGRRRCGRRSWRGWC